MKILLSLALLISLPLHAKEWQAGKTIFLLSQDKNGDWFNSACMKSCSLETLAKKYLKTHELSAEDLAGGKNPGSVLCHKLQGKVLYLSSKDETLAVCQLKDEVLSLSKLASLSFEE